MHETTSSGAELFRAGGRTDGQTGMTKPEVAFCNFSNAPKKWKPFHFGRSGEYGLFLLYSTTDCTLTTEISLVREAKCPRKLDYGD